MLSHPKQRIHGKRVILNENSTVFTAELIRSENLEHAKCVQFFRDKNDENFLGFRFHFIENTEVSYSYKLIKTAISKGTATRSCHANALFRKMKSVSHIMQLENKNDRTFKVMPYPDMNNAFYTQLVPSFEESISFFNLSEIDKKEMGIYRCIDEFGVVLYIGSGLIRQESINAQKKSKDQFISIEYSLLQNRDDAYHWEHHHQTLHYERYGELPKFNEVFAPGNKTLSREGVKNESSK